jgi:hypothetical protein
MKKYVMLLLALVLVFSMGALVGCGDEAEDVGTTENVEDVVVEEPADDAQGGDATFANNIITTPRMIIEITDYRVIQPGDAGNEFGDEPVVAFWYEVTNLTDADLNPSTAWIMTVNAFQDNDPNMENELSVALHPDSDLVDNQLANITEGGTVKNAVAYILSDTTTPVELTASENLGITTFGSAEFSLN